MVKTKCCALLKARWLSLLAMLLGLCVGNAMAQFPPDQQHAAAFTGDWCAQGDLAKRALIVDNGAFLNLTDENGGKFIGHYQGKNSIVVPDWQFVTGTLAADQRQINWSNGTLWTRCSLPGVARRLNLTGTWLAQGNHQQICTIHQHDDELELSRRSGGVGSGMITGKRQVTTNWSGVIVDGRVTEDGNRIEWNDGTYWTRYRLYERTIHSADAIQ